MAEVFKFEFEADVLKALKSIQDFSKKSSEAAQAIQSSFSGLEKIGAGVVAIFAGGKILSGIEAVIHAASQEEQAIQELNVALKNNGRFTEEASKSLVEFADSLEETSKFSNEAILSTATLIENLTGLSEQGLKQATQAAVDLSAAIGIDLNSAANLVAKAANGNVETFKRYGIVITKGKDETQTFANTLQALAKFQGTAEAQTKTYSGALIQAGNAYEQVLKAAGGFIINNETIIGLINSVTHALIGLASTIKNLPKLYEENSARIAEFGRHLVTVLATISGYLVITNFSTALSGLKSVFSGVGGIIANATKALIEYITFAGRADAATKRLQLGLNILKGIATLGITIAIEQAIVKLIEMKQEFGTLTNVFKAIGINLEIAFTKAFAAIGPTLSSFIEKLSDIPLIGKSINFSGISKGLSDAAGTASSKIAELEKNLSTLRAPEELGNSLNRATASTKAGVEEANRLKRELLDAAKASEKIAPEIQKLQSDLKNAGKTQLQIIVEERQARLDLINESKRLGVINAEETAKLTSQVQLDYAEKANKEIAKMNEDLLKQKLEQEKKNQEQIQAITQGASFAISTISGAADKPSAPKVDVEPAIEAERKLRDQRIKLIEESFNAGTITDAQRKAAIDQITFETEEKEKAIKAEADERNKLLEKQLKQQEAATTLLAKGVGAAGTALFGPFGALAGDLVGLLAQGGDALKQVVAGIAAALPQIITTMAQAIGPLITTLIQSVPTILTGLLTGINQLIIGLVDSIPLIIQSFVDNIGPFIDSLIQGALQLIATLVEKAPDIMIALANATPKFTAALQAQAPQIIATMVKEAPKFAVAAARSFVQQIPKMAIEMARGIVEAIKSIIGSVTGVAGDVVGGIGGAISSVGDFLGFAEGGQVPAGFPNDTFPARLTSGEFVIDRTDNQRLSRFLDRQESGGSNNAQISELVSLLKSDSGKNLSINITVGEKQLAEVLLNLNRRGFRTA